MSNKTLNINLIENDSSFVKLVDLISDMWVSGFSFRLKRKINGNNRIADTEEIESIKQARDLYFWNYSIQDLLEVNHELSTGNSLQKSVELLSYAKKMIISNGNLLDEISVKNGTKIILQWGGVFKKGNRDKCIIPEYSLTKDYEEVSKVWNNILSGKSDFRLDDNFNFESNAGFTKVYSLILDDFIIYDSRVSVALAYIIQNSFTIEEVPDYLKLFIPPSYDQNNKRLVSPIFKSTNSNKKRHFFSNVISNLILKSVAAKINLGKQEPDKVTLRDIEAALFMIGYDIRN